MDREGPKEGGEGRGGEGEEKGEEEEADFGPGPPNNEDLSFFLSKVLVRCLRIFILSKPRSLSSRPTHVTYV